MANSIKQHKDTLRLQVTNPARAAGLVEETGKGDDRRTTYRADVRVHAFDRLILIGDTTIDDARWAYLVRKAAEYTESSYRATETSLQHDGNGYSVGLGPASDAGFYLDDTPGVHTGPKLLILTDDSVAKLGQELTDLRKDQRHAGTIDGTPA